MFRGGFAKAAERPAGGVQQISSETNARRVLSVCWPVLTRFLKSTLILHKKGLLYLNLRMASFAENHFCSSKNRNSVKLCLY